MLVYFMRWAGVKFDEMLKLLVLIWGLDTFDVYFKVFEIAFDIMSMTRIKSNINLKSLHFEIKTQ